MATYVVRVELHGAGGSEAAYNNLHNMMNSAGFRRWVTFSDGTWKLPTGLYLAEANTGLYGAVRDKAVAAANLTGYANEVFVAEIYGSNMCSSSLSRWH